MSSSDPDTGPAQPAIVVKPGPQTTEFYQSLLTNLLAVAVALLSLFGSNFNLSGLQPLIPAIAVLASAAASAWYTHSRSSVKSAAYQANVAVATGSNDAATQLGVTAPIPTKTLDGASAAVAAAP